MRPEPARAHDVPGLWGYVDRINVAPGEAAILRVSSPAAYSVDLLRPRNAALLDPDAVATADRDDLDVLASFRHAIATPATISPGSYLSVEGEPLAPPFTIGVWLRPWRIPVIDDVQWQWAGIVTDLDYPEHCSFGLLIDHLGRVGLYLGDGGMFRHEWLRYARRSIVQDLGRWTHIAASVDRDRVRIYISGSLEHESESNGTAIVASRFAHLRIGASAEAGAADNFLDGDIAQPFISRAILGPDQLTAVVADQARTDLSALLPQLLGYWPLDEERGALVHDRSGNGRQATLVNGAAWQIGGPAFDPADRGVDYDPAGDPARGHGLRLSSDDLVDCEWPETDRYVVPDDAESGIVAARVRMEGQAPEDVLTIPFVIVRRQPRRAGSVALLCATNTWYAYGRRPKDQQATAGLSASFYSSHVNGRPFFHVATRAPIPRANPFTSESERAARTGSSHLVRPERYAEAWLRQQGYPFECITDLDLDGEPSLLQRFRALVICGHNEYWTDSMRAGLQAYLDAGGRVLSMSGNTLYWRVSYDAATGLLESRKTSDGEDSQWLSPRWWGERVHTDGKPGGTWQAVGQPGYRLLGLDTQGMIDDGTPTSFAPFTVTAADHFLFTTPEQVPLGPDRLLGARSLNGPQASGYEFDATPDHLGVRATPLEGLTVLASATDQLNIETMGKDPTHGGDIIHWLRPEGGEVVSIGSISFTGALPVDAAAATFVSNVLSHFGVPRKDIGSTP